MQKSAPRRTALLLIICLPFVLLNLTQASAQSTATSITPANKKGPAINDLASGTSELKIESITPHHQDEVTPLDHGSIDKQFLADPDATSNGEMLAAGTDVKGSADYVAVERVTGKLAGRAGTFVLQHSGTMNRGSPELSVVVAADSGTAQLVGLVGK